MSDRQLKIVLLGDSSVGKTCLTLQYITGKVEKNYLSTIGVDVHKKTITVDDQSYSLQIWDTAGQERFRAISASYLRNTDGILLLYDITNQASFDHITDWLQTIRQNCSDGAVLLIGNKCDLKDQRQVQYVEGKELAEKENAKFLEVSAYTGENLEETFIEITKEILRVGKEKGEANGVTLKKENNRQRGGCC